METSQGILSLWASLRLANAPDTRQGANTSIDTSPANKNTRMRSKHSWETLTLTSAATILAGSHY